MLVCREGLARSAACKNRRDALREMGFDLGRGELSYILGVEFSAIVLLKRVLTPVVSVIAGDNSASSQL